MLILCIGSSRGVLLRTSPWILGSQGAFDLRQHHKLFPWCGYTKYHNGCCYPCLPNTFNLETASPNVTKDCSVRHICSWWLVSCYRSPYTIELIRGSIILVSSLRLVSVIQAQGNKDVTCKTMFPP